MKKLFLTGLSAIACASSPLYPAIPKIADSELQPFAYAKIAPIQQTVTKLGQALQAIKPGPQTMMVTAGMGMALGDPTFSTFDAKANTGIYVFNDFDDKDEPTVVVLLKVAKESPVPAALTKNIGLNASTHGDWTVLTNHPEQLKNIPDLAPLAQHTSLKASADIEAAFLPGSLLANKFINKSLDELKATAGELESKDHGKAATTILETALAEAGDLETVGMTFDIGNTDFNVAYTVGLRPGSDIAKALQAPGGDVPEAKLVANEGLVSGIFAYNSKDYFDYWRGILAKLKPGMQGKLAEFHQEMVDYMAETEKILPARQTGAVNFNFSMDGFIPQPAFNAVIAANLTVEQLEEYQRKEREISLKIFELLKETPGLDEFFEEAGETLELMFKEGGKAQKVEIAGTPVLHVKESVPVEDIPGEDMSMDFGYYATAKNKMLLTSTSKEGMEALIKNQAAGKAAENALDGKLAKGEYMKGNFSVKPYAKIMIGMTMMSFGGEEEEEQENPLMKEFEALQLNPWPILVTEQDSVIKTNVGISYASLKTLTEFSEKAMKKAMGGAGSATASLDIEESKIDYSEIEIPMDLPFALSNGGTTTLAQLTKGKKAVLLDFWASWCGPCMALMPELKKKEAALRKQGIVVAGMNTEAEPDTAEKTRKKLDIQFNWLVEPDDAPLSDLLEIDSIPRMVLISPEGKVLYNGHPQDPSLNVALAQLGVDL